MKKSITSILCAVLFLAISSTAGATVSDYIPVGGVLTDLSGTPLDGDYDLVFALYDGETAATAVWTESYAALSIEDGLFTVYLGAVTPLDFTALIDASELWLGVTVGTDSEMDRIPLGSVPFAVEAYECQYIGDLAEADIQPMLVGANECPEGTFLRGWDDVAGAPICGADDTGTALPGRASPPSSNTTTALVTTDAVGTYPSITIGADGLGSSPTRTTPQAASTWPTATTWSAPPPRSQPSWPRPPSPRSPSARTGSRRWSPRDRAPSSSTTATTWPAPPPPTPPSSPEPPESPPWRSARTACRSSATSAIRGTDGNFEVAHCNDVACGTFSTSVAVTDDYVSKYTWSGIGADGMPVFSFQRWYSGDEDIHLLHCDDVACTSSTNSNITNLDDPRSPVMTIGADGLPLIMLEYYYGGSVRFFHCDNTVCTSATMISPSHDWSNTQSAQDKLSLTVGTDGLPFATLSGVNAFPERLLALHCSDYMCSTVGATVIETAGAGGETSVTIGVDGNPLIAYRNSTSNDLMVTHCSNKLCVPFFRRR